MPHALIPGIMPPSHCQSSSHMAFHVESNRSSSTPIHHHISSAACTQKEPQVHYLLTRFTSFYLCFLTFSLSPPLPCLSSFSLILSFLSIFSFTRISAVLIPPSLKVLIS
jgi:hypothetical protein